MAKAEIEGGCVLLARMITNSSLWKMPDGCVRLAMYFLAEANWKNSKWFDRYQHKEIIVKRGELTGTQVKWAKKNHKTRKAFRTAFRQLAEHGFLRDITPKAVKRASGYTHVRICKYEYYQDLTNYRGAKRATEGPPRGHRGATEGPLPNKDEERKEGGGGEVLLPSNFSQKQKEEVVQLFVDAWQLLHGKRWETPDEYLLTSFEKRDLRSLLTPANLETYIAYAYHYHHDKGVGIRPGEKAPTIDRFINKEAPKYCSTLREGTDKWRQATTFAREFLAEKASE